MRRVEVFVVLLRRRRGPSPRERRGFERRVVRVVHVRLVSTGWHPPLEPSRVLRVFRVQNGTRGVRSAPPGRVSAAARARIRRARAATASRSRDQTRSGPHPRRNAPPTFVSTLVSTLVPAPSPRDVPVPVPVPVPEGFSLVDFPPERRKSSQRAGGRARHVREHGVVPAAQMRHRAQIQRRTRRHSLRTPRACRRRAKMSQSPPVDVEAVHLEIKRAAKSASPRARESRRHRQRLPAVPRAQIQNLPEARRFPRRALGGGGVEDGVRDGGCDALRARLALRTIPRDTSLTRTPRREDDPP